jgi:hypothetical protein
VKTIYKYAIHPGVYSLYLPEGSEALSVDIQYGEPQMWVLQDTSKPVVCRYGTGHQLPEDDMRFIGTFFGDSGVFVFHLFERVEKPIDKA